MRAKFLFITCSIVLCSCSSQEQTKIFNDEVPEVLIEHEYDEVEIFHIQWNEIFDQDYDEYFVYFYSLTCNHCNDFKNWIIQKALDEGNIYFVKSSNKDVLRKDTKNTIGAGFIGDFWIVGYPSMAKIVNKKVEKNVAGKTEIQKLFV